ncbi:MAG: NACHT domain-containing protein [Oscillatoria sp. SIO1A7]|nr:NACHT domain-containing protein [Oscillatoria sp. SIO1A7]
MQSIDDRVLDFYGYLFESLFSKPFRTSIADRRKCNRVIRQVEAAADAASSSLTRFLLSQNLGEARVEEILGSFAAMANLLQLENISNSNFTTEAIVEDLLADLASAGAGRESQNAVYRLALYTVVQVLMQVGPVMAEWQKLNFSSTFELPRKVVNRLNEISSQIDAQGRSGRAGSDESYEIMHRDYLLQRFYQVEAGTVRMTTNLNVDLRELFVMPRVAVRQSSQDLESGERHALASLMNLAAARRLYENRSRKIQEEALEDSEAKEKLFPTALEQAKGSARMVVVGLPGMGKSTFLEWLQVKLASVEEQLVLGGQQAIPLLLRVRQLDLQNLPKGAALIQKATASKERADLMPQDWLARQMKAGKVLFMLDGLDEAEPENLEKYLLPWLFELLEQYPNCHYLISSRPVGYPRGLLTQQGFSECDLLDFDAAQIRDYARHWCTAVRLARNESETEARQEGEEDGDRIVAGFEEHPYISNLAKNPLMLSAICLVNYFEGGRLPEDRALLYRLCVEGLLHNWDLRRGIRSEFGFQEKLQACREVALAMQAEDRAEWEAERVREIFARVLDDSGRASQLLEHIRYRTGLLLERRPNVFGFAHLTFQEYLAARAIHEGNGLGINASQLAPEHDDGRWKEVIALYCGLATTPTVRDLIELLIAQPDTESLGEVLTEAYLSAGSELARDKELRQRVLERVAIAPVAELPPVSLSRFPQEEVAPIANRLVGTIQNCIGLSESHHWLSKNKDFLEVKPLAKRLQKWQSMTPFQRSELVHLLHRLAPDETLLEIAANADLYRSKGPHFDYDMNYYSQAEIALIGLAGREWSESSLKSFKASLRQAFSALLNVEGVFWETLTETKELLTQHLSDIFISSWSLEERQEFASLARQLADRLKTMKLDEGPMETREPAIEALKDWADVLEGVEPRTG